ncbi:hypothetical protein STEG23_007165 [Scotinomys teguina]
MPKEVPGAWPPHPPRPPVPPPSAPVSPVPVPAATRAEEDSGSHNRSTAKPASPLGCRRTNGAGGPGRPKAASRLRAHETPASPPPRRADGVGGGAPAPLRNAGYAGRAVGPGSPPRGHEGHRSSPETLGRTPPPAVRATSAEPGPVRRARCAAAHTGPARLRTPPAAAAAAAAATASVPRLREQNKQPCRRRQRTDVTAHAARAAPRHRRARRARPAGPPSCRELRRSRRQVKITWVSVPSSYIVVHNPLNSRNAESGATTTTTHKTAAIMERRTQNRCNNGEEDTKLLQ